MEFRFTVCKNCHHKFESHDADGLCHHAWDGFCECIGFEYGHPEIGELGAPRMPTPVSENKY